MKARVLNGIIAGITAAALSLNAACDSSGWILAGNIAGWLIIVGTLWFVIDNKIKEAQQ